MLAEGEESLEKGRQNFAERGTVHGREFASVNKYGSDTDTPLSIGTLLWNCPAELSW
jgi:hypothetical protein